MTAPRTRLPSLNFPDETDSHSVAQPPKRGVGLQAPSVTKCRHRASFPEVNAALLVRMLRRFRYLFVDCVQRKLFLPLLLADQNHCGVARPSKIVLWKAAPVHMIRVS
jgi:hypothetical protein